MEIFNIYRELLDECFPNPPMDVPNIWMDINKKYPVDVVSITEENKDNIVGACTVVKISEGFYGIGWVCIKPELRGKNYGNKLMQKVHNKYKGIFITKTSSSKDFYLKLGYTVVYGDENGSVLCYVNDIEKIDF